MQKTSQNTNLSRGGGGRAYLTRFLFDFCFKKREKMKSETVTDFPFSKRGVAGINF
jgi:hypothetical protein